LGIVGVLWGLLPTDAAPGSVDRRREFCEITMFRCQRNSLISNKTALGEGPYCVSIRDTGGWLNRPADRVAPVGGWEMLEIACSALFRAQVVAQQTSLDIDAFLQEPFGQIPDARTLTALQRVDQR